MGSLFHLLFHTPVLKSIEDQGAEEHHAGNNLRSVRVKSEYLVLDYAFRIISNNYFILNNAKPRFLNTQEVLDF